MKVSGSREFLGKVSTVFTKNLSSEGLRRENNVICLGNSIGYFFKWFSINLAIFDYSGFML